MAAKKSWRKQNDDWKLFFTNSKGNFHIGSVYEENGIFKIELYSLDIDDEFSFPCRNTMPTASEGKQYLSELFDRINKRDPKDSSMFTYYNLLCYDLLKD